jgi:hypothetical protein
VFEQPLGLGLGEDREKGIDARLDGTFAQQLGAEAMDGADVRLFERGQRLVERLQFTRRLLGERHRDHVGDASLAAGQQADDAGHELGGLAGSCRGLHDECVVER